MIKLPLIKVIRLLRVIQKSSNFLKYYSVGSILCTNTESNQGVCLVTKFDIRTNEYHSYLYLINIETLKVIDYLYVETYSKEFIEEYGCPDIPLVADETIYITWERTVNGRRLDEFLGWDNIKMKTVTINKVKEGKHKDYYYLVR